MRKPMRWSRWMSLVLTVLLMLAVTPVALGSSHESDAQAYCTEQGGNVVTLKPYLYPDSDQQTELAGSLDVCQFISQVDDSVEQIVVDLETLYSEKPTLAGLAYLARVPSSGSGAAGSNPASSYCPDDLAGTEAFGTAASGAWVGDLDPGMEAGRTSRSGTA